MKHLAIWWSVAHGAHLIAKHGIGCTNKQIRKGTRLKPTYYSQGTSRDPLSGKTTSHTKNWAV